MGKRGKWWGRGDEEAFIVVQLVILVLLMLLMLMMLTFWCYEVKAIAQDAKEGCPGTESVRKVLRELHYGYAILCQHQLV